MQQAVMGRDTDGLSADALRGIGLQELDKRAQGHADLVSIYLGWLQEHLNDWDLSDSAAFRPQVESWYASLRFHGYDDRHIHDSLAAWMSSQIQDDASCARRLLVAQQELLAILDDDQAKQPRDHGMDQGIASVITVNEDKIIDISSGDGDSDVEFLGWKPPQNMRNTSKSAKPKLPPLTGANREHQRMQETVCLEPNDESKGDKARKAGPNRMPSGTPPKGYVCGRCGEKGHFKERCPTNLDPSLDPKPTGGYKCYCCGAKEDHLTTLCPYNKNPNSLTQQRIKAGVAQRARSSSPPGADHYRPPYNKPRKGKKTPSRSMDGAPSRENRRVQRRFEDDDDDHYMDPARRALLERDSRGRSSSWSDDRMEGLLRSHYSPPREKRGRRSSIGESHRAKRARRWRRRPRSGSQSSRGEREGSAELLPRGDHHSGGDGRLSYWDDYYNDVKMSSTSPSEEHRPVVPVVYLPSDNLGADIRRLHPNADASWVRDMASFDVNVFFRELELCRPTVARIQVEEDTQMEMGIFDDADEGRALPTVRLPVRLAPAQETSTGALSELKSLNGKQHSPASFDETSQTNNAGDRASFIQNGEIVVRLPQGSRTALSIDKFSAQLKVDSPPPDALNEHMDPQAANDKSRISLRDMGLTTDDADGGHKARILVEE